MINKELNDEQLNGIVGGSVSKRQLSVCIEVPELIGDVTIKVYLDGEFDVSKTKTVDCSVKHVNYTFSGTGLKDLTVKFNDIKTKKYVLNFDDYSYRQID